MCKSSSVYGEKPNIEDEKVIEFHRQEILAKRVPFFFAMNVLLLLCCYNASLYI